MERDEIIRLTREDFKKSITKDFIIIQTIHSIDEISAMINKLYANLRERYGYYAPRTSKIEDNDKFLKQLFLRNKEDLVTIVRSYNNLYRKEEFFLKLTNCNH